MNKNAVLWVLLAGLAAAAAYLFFRKKKESANGALPNTGTGNVLTPLFSGLRQKSNLDLKKVDDQFTAFQSTPSIGKQAAASGAALGIQLSGEALKKIFGAVKNKLFPQDKVAPGRADDPEAYEPWDAEVPAGVIPDVPEPPWGSDEFDREQLDSIVNDPSTWFDFPDSGWSSPIESPDASGFGDWEPSFASADFEGLG